MSLDLKQSLLALAVATTLAGCNLSVKIVDNTGTENTGGTVTSEDGNIDCPAVSCAFNYPGFSETVTLTAQAQPGYDFAGFSDAATNCSNGEDDSLATGTCVTKAAMPKTITVTFNDSSYVDPCPGDDEDNCLANPEGDFDGDGVDNATDVCPENNPDSCPAGDLDGDGVNNGDDACPMDADDSCDQGDLDGDGILNGADVCPLDASNDCLDNPLGDFDGDGVANGQDACPQDNPDTCPAGDQDNDGVTNQADNCPVNSNSDQADFDSDGQGNACDNDDDNDGAEDALDCGPLDTSMYPGATEIPDGKDNNCNGSVDEGTELRAPTDIRKVDSGCCHTWGEFEWTPTPYNDGYEIHMEGYFGGGCLTDHSAVIDGQVGRGRVTAVGLCLGSKYNVKIRARRNGQWSAWSSTVRITL